MWAGAGIGDGNRHAGQPGLHRRRSRAAGHSAAARAQWIRFVDECQTATDHRVLITVPVLVVSLILGVTGLAILWRRFGRPDRPATPPVDRWPPAYGPAPGAPPPYAASYPGTGGPTHPPGGVSTV